MDSEWDELPEWNEIQSHISRLGRLKRGSFYISDSDVSDSRFCGVPKRISNKNQFYIKTFDSKDFPTIDYFSFYRSIRPESELQTKYRTQTGRAVRSGPPIPGYFIHVRTVNRSDPPWSEYLLVNEYLVKAPQDRLVLAIAVSGNIRMSKDGDGEICHVLRMPDLVQYFAFSNL